jgi:hypothetical protein
VACEPAEFDDDDLFERAPEFDDDESLEARDLEWDEELLEREPSAEDTEALEARESDSVELLEAREPNIFTRFKDWFNRKILRRKKKGSKHASKPKPAPAPTSSETPETREIDEDLQSFFSREEELNPD